MLHVIFGQHDVSADLLATTWFVAEFEIQILNLDGDWKVVEGDWDGAFMIFSMELWDPGTPGLLNEYLIGVMTL